MRREQTARCESFIAALRGAIEIGAARAIAVALRALEHQARLHGAYAQPDAVVTINNIAAIDLAALPPKEREVLKMKLYELDPTIPIQIARSMLADIEADDAPSPSPSLSTTRALPPPDESSLVTIEEARRALSERQHKLAAGRDGLMAPARSVTILKNDAYSTKDRQLRSWRDAVFGLPHMIIGCSILYSVTEVSNWLQRGAKRAPGGPCKTRQLANRS